MENDFRRNGCLSLVERMNPYVSRMWDDGTVFHIEDGKLVLKELRYKGFKIPIKYGELPKSKSWYKGFRLPDDNVDRLDALCKLVEAFLFGAEEHADAAAGIIMALPMIKDEDEKALQAKE